jgi:phosphopantothenoylcysteine synthetase/decarboxylase
MTAELTGKHLVVTSGPTWAPVDAVRYLTNRSSGQVGARIARESLRRGAHVTLIAGRGSVLPGPNELTDEERARFRVVQIETVPELIAALEAELPGDPQPDAVIHAMAVLDYVPAGARSEKVPSGLAEWTVALVPAPKAIRTVRALAPRALLVQFKLEVAVTDDALRATAAESLGANDADLVVANDLARIHGESHPALVIDASGEVLCRPASKEAIAVCLCDLVADRLSVDAAGQ